jgi:hypothetical protein
MHIKASIAAVFLAMLALTGWAADDSLPAEPPQGWELLTSPGKNWSVWLPKDGERSVESKTIDLENMKRKVEMVVQKAPNKTAYFAGHLSLSTKPNEKADPKPVIEAFRQAFVESGKVLEETDTMLLKIPGKEFLMQVEKDRMMRLRVFCGPYRLYIIGVVGSKEQVQDDAATLFFRSFKHQGQIRAAELKKK